MALSAWGSNQPVGVVRAEAVGNVMFAHLWRHESGGTFLPSPRSRRRLYLTTTMPGAHQRLLRQCRVGCKTGGPGPSELLPPCSCLSGTGIGSDDAQPNKKKEEEEMSWRETANKTYVMASTEAEKKEDKSDKKHINKETKF